MSNPPSAPFPFSKIKKCPDFVHLEVKYAIQNIVLRVSGTKSSKSFYCGTFFP